MQTSPAFFVFNPSDEEKKRLQLVEALYSSKLKGWFLTSEQKEKFDKYTNDKSSIPVPTIQPVGKGIGIFVEDLITEWKISGDTYSRKDKIKALGARFNGVDKSWRIPRHATSKDNIISALQ